MLRSIRFTAQIYSRVVVINALNQPKQFCTALKCNYTNKSDDLQKQIEIETKKGRNTVHLQENLCNAYIEEKNVEKIEELTKNHVFGDYIHHRIIKMHIEMGNTEQALNHFDEIREKRPNFKLTKIEAARLARSMFMEEREWAEIIRIFTENKQLPTKVQNEEEILFFLRQVAQTGKVTEMEEVFDVLSANNFLVKDSQTAGYLVKVHLMNKDLPGAVRTFEKQFEERKFTSNYMPLMMALIVANDLEKLEIVFKLMLSKFSEGNAVLSLVTCFIKTGYFSQARILLENNMLRISDYEFRKYCERYCGFGEYSAMEDLLVVTAGLEYDRTQIYRRLLEHFCDQNKTDEAIALWRTQRAEGEEPTNEFLRWLASHLKEKGLEVPFRVPESTPHLLDGAFPEMKIALQNGNVDAALEAWNNPDSSRYTYIASNLVRLLCKTNRFAEAVDIAMQTILMPGRVTDTVLRELIQQLAGDGNSQLLDRLGASLPRTTKRSIQFGCALLKAYEKSGKWNEFFSTTLEKIRRKAYINDRFPMTDLLALLQNQTIHLSDFERFAEEAADAGACRPLNVLWAHYFLTDSPKSDKLYDKFEQDFPTKLEMAYLGSYLVEVGDEEKLDKLRDFVKIKNEKQLPAINIVSLVARTTKGTKKASMMI